MICRTANEAGETVAQREEWLAGREAAENSVQRGTTGKIEEGIRGKSIPDREKEATTLERSGIERGADQDLVPKQKSENQKGERAEKSARSTIDGSRPVQSLHGPR